MSTSETPAETVLSARGLVMRFGGITATNDVTLDLKKGARHALIGPNGAGKTTLINLLTGVLEPTAGTITLELSIKLSGQLAVGVPGEHSERGPGRLTDS